MQNPRCIKLKCDNYIYWQSKVEKKLEREKSDYVMEDTEYIG